MLNIKHLKNFILNTIAIILISSCSILKPQPNTETIINYRDSTIVNTIDSTIYIPVERIVDIVPIYDTLKLESSKAIAEAYVDTTYHVLRGSIENKTGIEYKYVYKDKIVYRDSIVVKEIPVEVEVEKIVRKNPWYFPVVLLFALVGIFTLIKIIWKIFYV